MSKFAIFARTAARAEQRIIELLEKSLRDDLAGACSNVDLQTSAQARQGQKSSG